MSNWSFLDYFVAVAREGNFTRAAHSLYYSQPYLSKKIAALEEELGVTLIDRTSKTVKLTPAGEDLYQRTLQINHDIVKAKQAIEKYKKHTGTTDDPLIIWSDSYGSYLTIELIRRFKHVYPQYHYKLLTETMGEPPDNAGIRCYFRPTTEEPHPKPLFYTQEKIFISSCIPQAKKAYLTVNDLKDLTGVTLDTVPRQLDWERELLKKYPDMKFIHVSNAFEAMHVLFDRKDTYEIWDAYSHEQNPLHGKIGLPLEGLDALEFFVDLVHPHDEAAVAFHQTAFAFCRNLD